MNVKQLIAALKKMPQNAQVYTRDHDQSEWQVNIRVGHVDHYVRSEILEEHANGWHQDLELEIFPTLRRWVTLSS